MNKYQNDFNAGIVGLGVYLPEKRVTEQDFINAGVPKEYIDMWGVHEHRVSDPDETPSDMSIKAAKDLIKNTGIDPREIDLIIDSALVPDYIHPGNSHRIQYEIGAKNAASIDVVPSGGGAISQLIMAKALIISGEYENILITCSSRFSSVADKTDWVNLVVGGDGSAAALVSKVGKDRGILSSNLLTKGEFYINSGIKALNNNALNGRGTVYESENSKMFFFINGATFASNTEKEKGESLDDFVYCSVPLSSRIALEKLNLSYNDVDFWITHQSVNNLYEYWLNAVGAKCKGNYYYSNSKYGNLFIANQLVNLKEALERSCIKEGDIVVLGGLVSGFAVGTVVVRWGT